MKDDGAPLAVRLRRVGALAVVPAILAFFIVNPWVRWPCPVRLLAHAPCPMCGMTRACLLVGHGSLAEAFAVHPAVLLVAPYLALVTPLEVLGVWRSGRLGAANENPVLRAFGYVIVIASVMLWIVRFFGYLGGPVPVDRGLFK